MSDAAGPSSSGPTGPLYLLPAAARASSRPGSEAGTEHSEQSSGKGSAAQHNRTMVKRGACPDPACSSSLALTGTLTDAGEELQATLASTALSMSTTGPSLVVLLGPPHVLMEELYLNHAPGLQKISLSNLTLEKVSIRLESDLGDAMSFMRSKQGSEVQGKQQWCPLIDWWLKVLCFPQTLIE